MRCAIMNNIFGTMLLSSDDAKATIPIVIFVLMSISIISDRNEQLQVRDSNQCFRRI